MVVLGRETSRRRRGGCGRRALLAIFCCCFACLIIIVICFRRCDATPCTGPCPWIRLPRLIYFGEQLERNRTLFVVFRCFFRRCIVAARLFSSTIVFLANGMAFWWVPILARAAARLQSVVLSFYRKNSRLLLGRVDGGRPATEGDGRAPPEHGRCGQTSQVKDAAVACPHFVFFVLLHA